MSKLLVSLIENYEVGAYITGAVDIFWSGDATVLHTVEDGHHVWVKKFHQVEWWGYGTSPSWELKP